MPVIYAIVRNWPPFSRDFTTSSIISSCFSCSNKAQGNPDITQSHLF